MTHRLAVASLLLLWILPAAGQPPADPGVDFFEKKIRPVLVQHCYACHSREAKKAKGKLLVDTKAALLKGGESGPAVVPGKPDESWLIKAVRATDPDLQMPPLGKLPAEAIANLEKWVALGAPDPRSGEVAGDGKYGPSVEEGRKFWAFQPVKRFAVPAVKATAWPRGVIDRFLLARLESAGLAPAPDADRATLLRRTYFALIGLPPSPAEIDAFLADTAPNAFARLVDRLLASPHFGERWGRHWLDLARYAESTGGGRSLLLKDAWRYRDYVFKAFNQDKPFDNFVVEQLAGDLLPWQSREERRDHLTATGYLLLGPHNYERQDKPILEMDIIDEILDTLGRSLLGMTLGCARCHDHKFDPIPTRDYYALAGIFKSTRFILHDNVSQWMSQPLPLSPLEEAAVQKHAAAVAALKEKVAAARPTPFARRREKATTDFRALQGQLKQLTMSGPQRPMAISVGEADKQIEQHICIRGNYHNKGPAVPRGVLQVATPVGKEVVIPAQESGRKQLAAWLTSADHPLTARVFVNRVWQHLFGAGLVRTVDNFGATGEPPSHPALLDYLASRFVEEGWSVKKLIREIVLSRAYQMSSSGLPGPAALALKVDPDNRLLWKMNRTRLDAEAIRDSILLAAGRLDETMGGPSMKPGTLLERDYVFDDTRRSVYTPIFRNRLLELFEVFDFADPNVCLGQRTVSTVATQALYLMNNPFVMDQAKFAAQKLLALPDLDDAGRIDYAYRMMLGRLPTAKERQLVLAYLQQEPGPREGAWERICQTLFACIDFRYVN